MGNFGDRLLRPSFSGILGRGHFPDLGFHPNFHTLTPQKLRGFSPKSPPAPRRAGGNLGGAPPAPNPGRNRGQSPQNSEFSWWFLRHRAGPAFGGDFGGDFWGVLGSAELSPCVFSCRSPQFFFFLLLLFLLPARFSLYGFTRQVSPSLLPFSCAPRKENVLGWGEPRP